LLPGNRGGNPSSGPTQPPPAVPKSRLQGHHGKTTFWQPPLGPRGGKTFNARGPAENFFFPNWAGGGASRGGRASKGFVGGCERGGETEKGGGGGKAEKKKKRDRGGPRKKRKRRGCWVGNFFFGGWIVFLFCQTQGQTHKKGPLQGSTGGGGRKAGFGGYLFFFFFFFFFWPPPHRKGHKPEGF